MKKDHREVTLATNVDPPLRVHITGLSSKNGEKCHLTAVDIPPRRQAEESRNESENNFRALVEAIPDMVFILNSQGVYLDYKGTKEDLGYQTKSIIGLKNRDITSPDFADLIDEKIKLTLQTRQMQEFEYQMQMPAKGICEYEARMVPNGHDSVIAIVRNITERKKTEAELLFRNAQLNSANVEKDKLFSIIAHDLRGPFNAFLGFTQIMVEDLPAMTLEDIQKIALIMRKSAINLYSLIENLLEWSMMHRGIIPFNPVSLPLALKIKNATEFIIPSAKKKEIGICYNIPDDLNVFVDVHMFDTIIRNLISNAVKFTPKKGDVAVSTNKLNDDFIEICIRDTGIGISMDLIGNLFLIGEQTGRRGTEGEPTAGLGLLICKDFIEKNGGKIWVESEECKGSAFYFTLPRFESQNS